MFNLNAKTKEGFTLIEALIAIFLVVVGVTGALFLVNRIVVFTDITASRLTALYLGQEGIEIVKNIRDTNFLRVHRGVAGAAWDDGLLICGVPTGCEVDFDDPGLVVFRDWYLKINGEFFNYGAVGVATPFKRRIIITPIDTPGSLAEIDKLEVSVKVFWTKRGIDHQVIVQENLYKWW